MESGNDKYDTHIEIHVLVDMYHNGKGWEKRPYRMSVKRIEPINYRLIKPRKTMLFKFKGELTLQLKPTIEDNVICKIIETYMPAVITTPHERLSGRLKRKGSNRIKAKVLWEL